MSEILQYDSMIELQNYNCNINTCNINTITSFIKQIDIYLIIIIQELQKVFNNNKLIDKNNIDLLILFLYTELQIYIQNILDVNKFDEKFTSNISKKLINKFKSYYNNIFTQILKFLYFTNNSILLSLCYFIFNLLKQVISILNTNNNIITEFIVEEKYHSIDNLIYYKEKLNIKETDTLHDIIQSINIFITTANRYITSLKTLKTLKEEEIPITQKDYIIMYIYKYIYNSIKFISDNIIKGNEGELLKKYIIDLIIIIKKNDIEKISNYMFLIQYLGNLLFINKKYEDVYLFINFYNYLLNLYSDIEFDTKYELNNINNTLKYNNNFGIDKFIIKYLKVNRRFTLFSNILEQEKLIRNISLIIKEELEQQKQLDINYRKSDNLLLNSIVTKYHLKEYLVTYINLHLTHIITSIDRIINDKPINDKPINDKPIIYIRINYLIRYLINILNNIKIKKNIITYIKVKLNIYFVLIKKLCTLLYIKQKYNKAIKLIEFYKLLKLFIDNLENNDTNYSQIDINYIDENIKDYEISDIITTYINADNNKIFFEIIEENELINQIEKIFEVISKDADNIRVGVIIIINDYMEDEKISVVKIDKHIKDKDIIYDNALEYLQKLKDLKDLEGGSVNKFKKTENKITVIYNKKKYTRVIYINDRKKYIKLNKTFMLLSKLKKI
jgi:hypothetical protein